MNQLLCLTLTTALLAGAGCRPEKVGEMNRSESGGRSSLAGAVVPQPMAAIADPCSLALTPHTGDSKEDREIARLQQSIPSARDAVPSLERLGWMFVGKARSSFDPGYYKLAEQCALCIESKRPDSAEALLLRGHILQNLHRFKEAEPLARKLVAERGAPFDLGLLGDVLMEMGRLKEAIEAYQKMIDLRPDAQGYARVAHIRWLTGNLDGALEVMLMAARASSPQAAESSAWIYSRLAFYQLHAGDLDAARQSCATAVELQKDYPPALLLRGRIHLADGQSAEAVEPLLRAARLNPLPEYHWTLAEALRAAGRNSEAGGIEAKLRRTGAADDPRTFALFLATRGEQVDLALDLARRELGERADVHTHDALAWALAASGRWQEARKHSQQALAEGTPDARLYLHAGIIAGNSGQPGEAREHLDKAAKLQQMLLPGERERLESAKRDLPGQTAAATNEAQQ
jgi:tetratricopeptide (TPR) repeat protein